MVCPKSTKFEPGAPSIDLSAPFLESYSNWIPSHRPQYDKDLYVWNLTTVINHFGARPVLEINTAAQEFCRHAMLLTKFE